MAVSGVGIGWRRPHWCVSPEFDGVSLRYQRVLELQLDWRCWISWCDLLSGRVVRGGRSGGLERAGGEAPALDGYHLLPLLL